MDIGHYSIFVCHYFISMCRRDSPKSFMSGLSGWLWLQTGTLRLVRNIFARLHNLPSSGSVLLCDCESSIVPRDSKSGLTVSSTLWEWCTNRAYISWCDAQHYLDPWERETEIVVARVCQSLPDSPPVEILVICLTEVSVHYPAPWYCTIIRK